MVNTDFREEVRNNIIGLSKNKLLAKSTKVWFEQSLTNKYSYNFIVFRFPLSNILKIWLRYKK